jgi:hypothetical protein
MMGEVAGELVDGAVVIGVEPGDECGEAAM